MQRFAICGLLAAALALLVPAGAASAGQKFEGANGATAAGEPSPPSLSVSFTVKSVDGKPKSVKKFQANGIPFTCSNGTSGTTAEPARLGKKMRVNKKKKFHGRAKLGSTTFVVKGKLKGGKRAKGIVRIFGPEANTPDVTCDSGQVTWRARG
jgi:hypothetical protein